MDIGTVLVVVLLIVLSLGAIIWMEIHSPKSNSNEHRHDSRASESNNMEVPEPHSPLLALRLNGSASRKTRTGGTTFMIQEVTIYVTETDSERLGELIESSHEQNDRANLPYVSKLEGELKYAEVVACEQIPPDVVTMRSKVKLKDLDTSEEKVYSIVFPSEANFDEGKISILPPLATALLGNKRGNIVEVEAPSRLRRLLISEILYQPESAGNYDL
jgi:regulator of nucleoside diphosphate kinase